MVFELVPKRILSIPIGRDKGLKNHMTHFDNDKNTMHTVSCLKFNYRNRARAREAKSKSNNRQKPLIPGEAKSSYWGPHWRSWRPHQGVYALFCRLQEPSKAFKKERGIIRSVWKRTLAVLCWQ